MTLMAVSSLTEIKYPLLSVVVPGGCSQVLHGVHAFRARPPSQGDPKMNNVRIAMLGSGFVATYYMDGLANVNGHEVVANFSRTPQRAKEFAERWFIPDPSSDLQKLIERGSPS
jgi:hypothetical protein